MSYMIIVEYNNQVYKSAPFDEEKLLRLYGKLEQISTLEQLVVENQLGGKDFFPQGVLQQSVIRIIQAKPRAEHLETSERQNHHRKGSRQRTLEKNSIEQTTER